MSSDLNWLKKNARNERDALLVYFLEQGLSMAEVGERAGFSGGLNADREKATYAAAVSRAAASDRIRSLRQAYRVYREHGDVAVAPEQEVLQRLTTIMRTSTDGAAITASKGLLEYHRRGAPRIVDARNAPMLVKAACSHPNILLQLVGIATGHLWRDGGMESMADWQVPAELEALDAMMRKTGLTPVKAVELLQTGTPKPNSRDPSGITSFVNTKSVTTLGGDDGFGDTGASSQKHQVIRRSAAFQL